MSLRCILAFAALAGCLFSRYAPGSLLTRAEGAPTEALTVGCLDVAMTAVTDAQVPESHVALRVAIGNRCDHAVAVDFNRLEAVGVYDVGRVPLYVLDPRREIHASTLDAHGEAVETFELAPRVPHDPRPASVCVTLASVTPADVPAERATRCLALPALLPRFSKGVLP